MGMMNKFKWFYSKTNSYYSPEVKITIPQSWQLADSHPLFLFVLSSFPWLLECCSKGRNGRSKQDHRPAHSAPRSSEHRPQWKCCCCWNKPCLKLFLDNEIYLFLSSLPPELKQVPFNPNTAMTKSHKNFMLAKIIVNLFSVFRLKVTSKLWKYTIKHKFIRHYWI